MRSFLFLAALALAGCGDAAPDLSIHDAWARATPGTAAAVYLTVDNRGGGGDELVGVSLAGARDAAVHRTSMDGGVMRMRRVDRLAIEARSKVELAPGGLHVMATGLSRPLVAGQSVEARLRFARSGERAVLVRIEALGPR